MVKYISDRIAVMYRGKIVEMGDADQIYHHAVHPYTRSLLSAVPQPDPISEKKRIRVPYQHEEVSDSLQAFQIQPGHSIYATEAQFKRWMKEVGLVNE